MEKTITSPPGSGRSFTRYACIVFAAFVVFLAAPTVLAQSTKSSDNNKKSRFEVFGGYSYLRDGGQNLNGWTGSIVVNVVRWVGVEANFDGHYERPGGLPIREYGFTFGPHISFTNKTRFTPFAFALFGGVLQIVRVSPTFSDTGFAGNFGGGMDIRINKRFSVRAVQIDAAHARFFGVGRTGTRISTGLVFHFGKR